MRENAIMIPAIVMPQKSGGCPEETPLKEPHAPHHVALHPAGGRHEVEKHYDRRHKVADDDAGYESGIRSFFSMEESGRSTPVTSMLPAKAPVTTAAYPPREIVPAEIVPPKKSITTATPKLAPELIPKIEAGEGLRNVVCRSRPDTASPAPAKKAVMAMGSLPPITMNRSGAASPASMSATPAAGMLTEPKKSVRTNSTTTVIDRRKNRMVESGLH